MIDKIITHGRSELWDMEIDSYKEVYLDSFYDDTVIDFLYYHCDEMYTGMHNLQRNKKQGWSVSIPIQCDIDKAVLEIACREIHQNCRFLISYSISHDTYINSEITILIEENMSIYDAFYFAESQENIILDYANALSRSKLAAISKKAVTDKVPVFSRALKKVELELSNFCTDDIENKTKIIEISSRLKSIESIEEKVFRKNISQFDIFKSFDDIAGVRCTCEFLDDVYEVLTYIKKNPLLSIKSIEDKIESPTEAGYRGVHIIVTTDVYYHGEVHDNIKVEIQLRTAFQNAWSMKTHQLMYKHEADIPEDISIIMRAMSDSLNAADNDAQRIKETL